MPKERDTTCRIRTTHLSAVDVVHDWASFAPSHSSKVTSAGGPRFASKHSVLFGLPIEPGTPTTGGISQTWLQRAGLHTMVNGILSSRDLYFFHDRPVRHIILPHMPSYNCCVTSSKMALVRISWIGQKSATLERIRVLFNPRDWAPHHQCPRGVSRFPSIKIP